MQQESDSVQNRLRFLSSFAEPYAQNHFGERAKSVGLAPSKIHHAEPETVLKFLYHHYAFNRSVSPGYNTIAVDAVDAVGAIRPDELWAEFQRRCEDEGWGLNTRVNRGAVRDVAELVQAVGNPFAWAATVVPRENSVRPVYERLVAIQGFGPKIVRFLCRDLVWVADVEDQIPIAERHKLQPVDVWTRRAIRVILDEPNHDDETLARKATQACATHEISGIHMNQGAWYLGAKVVDGDLSAFVRSLQLTELPDPALNVEVEQQI